MILLVVLLLASPLMADSFTYKGRQRTYVVSAPRSSRPLGVFVLLHCNGGNGGMAVGRWAKIVHPDGVLCVGPNSLNQAAAWRDNENEGIDFIKALVKEVAKKYRIDGKRIYIGGYSAGACHSCRIGIPNSDYFAGIITYAGCSGPALGPRKIAVALVHGEKDGNIKVDGTRRLHETLKNAGWPVWYKEIPGQGHAYNPQYNRQAWEWVKKHPPKDPPELVAKQKLEEGKEAFEKKNYDEAYKAYKEALATGLKKEEAQAGIKQIEELGDKEIEEALSAAEKSRSKSRRLLKKLMSTFKDTPVAEKVKAALEKLEAEQSVSEESEKEAEPDETKKPLPKVEEETPKGLMEKANRYLDSGMKDAARQILQRLADKFPDSPEARDAARKLAELEE
jgi:poly(3-hydroxybutyrate) depolymerase